jgi:small subunit ribosomal protein S20
MPNSLSAKKRLRSSAREAEQNKSHRSRIGSLRRAFMEEADKGDPASGREAFVRYCSALDRAAKKGVIKKNTAVRRKTRAANRLRALTPSA